MHHTGFFTDEELASYREFSCRISTTNGWIELLASRAEGKAAKFEYLRSIPSWSLPFGGIVLIDGLVSTFPV